ncbi:MAG TPA: hypothetical protein VFI68_15470, partial [Anaerolineales bacterium]|nr:hypothetical protein [Anaerolineales bacterium]
MKKRLLPLKKLSIGNPGDWPLATKLPLLVVIPTGIVLIVLSLLTVTTLNQLQADTSSNTLQEDVQIVSQRFDEHQTNLSTDAAHLTIDPLLLDALESRDVDSIQKTLLSASTSQGFDNLEILDTNGRTLSVIQTFDPAEASADFEQ